MKRLLTIAEVSEALQLSAESVYALVRREHLPATKLGTGWRFRVSEVRKYLYERRSRR